MEWRSVSVSTEDGYPLLYRVWEPPTGTGGPTLILVHGIASHSGWFGPLIDPLLAAGVRVVGADRRGSGIHRRLRGDAPRASILVDDLARVLDAESLDAESSDGREVFVLGWCWGAVLALNLLSVRTPSAVAGLILAAPGLYPSGAVIDAMSAQDDLVSTAAEDAPVVATPVPDRMFTTDPDSLDFMARDPDRLTHVTPRFVRAMGKLAFRAKSGIRRIDVPTLVILPSEDETVDEEATRSALAALQPEPTLRTVPGPHGLQFEAARDFADAVLDFVFAETREERRG